MALLLLARIVRVKMTSESNKKKWQSQAIKNEDLWRGKLFWVVHPVYYTHFCVCVAWSKQDAFVTPSSCSHYYCHWCCDAVITLVIIIFLYVHARNSVETRLVGHSRTVITQPGSSLSLPCRILGLENLNVGATSSGSLAILSPDTAVSWTLNGRRVGFDGNVYMKPGRSSLSFFGVKKSMTGNYTCQLKYTTSSTRGTHSKSTSKKVINGMDSSVSFSSSSSPTFPAQLSAQQHKAQLTYSLIVRGIDLSLTIIGFFKQRTLST